MAYQYWWLTFWHKQRKNIPCTRTWPPRCQVPVSGCSGASRGRPLPDAACPRPGWAAAGPLSHPRPHPAAWTSRSSDGSAQRFPERVWSAAPPDLWSPTESNHARLKRARYTGNPFCDNNIQNQPGNKQLLVDHNMDFLNFPLYWL